MPGRADLEDGGDEIDAGKQRPDAGYLQRDKIIIDPDTRREFLLAERREGQPARPRELADEQADVDQQRARRGQPEADIVHRREGDVANAELQRHDEVHQADDERHRHEEDHDRAVRGEDLVVMLGRQIALRRTDRHRLLRAHHDRVGEAADQHQQRQHDVHDADLLVIGGRDVLVPEVGPPALAPDPDANTPSTARITNSDVISGIGSWNGMASQLSLPSMPQTPCSVVGRIVRQLLRPRRLVRRRSRRTGRARPRHRSSASHSCSA